MTDTISSKHPKGLYFIYTVAIAERLDITACGRCSCCI